MTLQELFHKIQEKRSFLCVGLDTDVKKIPQHLLEQDDPIFAFNKAIIDATAPYAVAYKPNSAFYESLGTFGAEALLHTIEYIKKEYPDLFVIADAKRGDIGNTSDMYARSFFQHFQADAITASPYMGEDSIKPFLDYPDKWTILLALTSNAGSADFQMMKDEHGEYLYQRVLRVSKEWGNEEQIMYVVGATKAEMLKDIREIIPNHFLLVPGVGAQGGSLDEVAHYGLNSHCGLLVNASRSIIYADSSENFAIRAANEAAALQRQMELILADKDLLPQSN